MNISGQTTQNGSEKSREKSRGKSRGKILGHISSNASITMAELADAIGISVKAVEKQIALLKKQGRIERIGPDKGGHWKINEGKT